MAHVDGIETESKGLPNLYPVNDVVFASIRIPHITGFQPALSVYDGSSSFRVPKVALHDERSSDVDLGLFFVPLNYAAILGDESGGGISHLWEKGWGAGPSLGFHSWQQFAHTAGMICIRP